MDTDLVAYVEKLVETTREELARADAKAAILATGSGVGISALLAGLIEAKWSPFQLHNAVEWVWWMGLASAAAALVCLGDAVFPRMATSRNTAHVVYFKDVVAVPRDDLVVRLERSAQLDERQVLDQLVELSSIANRKYLSIRYSIWCLSVAVLFTSAAVLINTML